MKVNVGDKEGVAVSEDDPLELPLDVLDKLAVSVVLEEVLRLRMEVGETAADEEALGVPVIDWVSLGELDRLIV